jgi:hypothetical protein
MTSEVTEEETKKTVSGTPGEEEEEDEYDYENEENLDFSNEHNENDDYDSELENDDFENGDDNDEADGDDANDNDNSNFAHVDSNEIVQLRFLLPDDAEFKSPWRVDLSVQRRRTIAQVKSRLCVRLKVSNEDRFQLQLATGLFPDNSLPIAACVRRGAPLAERLFVVRRDVNLRVQAAVAERLSSILTPRAGGTTSSIDDDDTTTSSTVLNTSGALDSAAVAAGTLGTTVAKAAPSSVAPAAPSGKKKLAVSAERQATAVVAPHAAAIAAIASSGDVGAADGARRAGRVSLSARSAGVQQSAEEVDALAAHVRQCLLIKAALVAKCAPTARARRAGCASPRASSCSR